MAKGRVVTLRSMGPAANDCTKVMMVIFSKHKANYLSGMITDEPSVLALLDRMKAQLLEAIEKGE